MTPSTVIIVGHLRRADIDGVARSAVAWLTSRGYRVSAEPDDALALGITGDLTLPFADVDPDDIGLVVSIGGDGTMLRAVALLGGRSAPILGVNAGLLGYLSEVEPDQLLQALDRFVSGDHVLEYRMMLDVLVRRRSGEEQVHRALNEASLEKTRSGQTVRLAVSIDGVPFTTYQADGLLVATPTGSTAYSLSARGPIVSPTHRALIVTPLAPHMLFDRSLVLDPSEYVEVQVTGSRPVELAVDGQEVCVLEEGDSISCRASSDHAVLVRLEPRRFHQVLKAKFGLADR